MKTNEVGISLNTECKKLIEEFMQRESGTLVDYLKEEITILVEKCIYIDNHAEDNLEHGANE